MIKGEDKNKCDVLPNRQGNPMHFEGESRGMRSRRARRGTIKLRPERAVILHNGATVF